MDIKDFILIGGGLLIAAVIVHGFWLAWRARRDPLRMDIAPEIPRGDVDEMVLLRGELPNGGARVVRGVVRPEQGSLDLETSAPLLMEPEDGFELAAPAVPQAQRPAKVEPVITGDQAAVAVAAPRSRPSRPQRSEPRQGESRAVPDAAPNAEVLVVNVLARGSERFNGSDLLEVFLRNGVKFGDMNIFHRLDPVTKAVQFSIANAVEPGTFDLSDMDALVTPGVTIFLQMPGPDDRSGAFDDMLNVARDIGQTLGGDLKDENLSVMTGQTIEHFRQRIADFSRKRMSMRVG